jgi:hypothetical protein
LIKRLGIVFLCYFQPIKPGNSNLEFGGLNLTMPFWFPKKDNAVIYIVFTGLLLLSLDFWGWNQSKPFFIGLPFWVYYLLFLTLATSFAFLIFSKYYWEEQ